MQGETFRRQKLILFGHMLIIFIRYCFPNHGGLEFNLSNALGTLTNGWRNCKISFLGTLQIYPGNLSAGTEYSWVITLFYNGLFQVELPRG
jgi:hypothetical protein